jgi:hypothetical protein
MADVTQGTLHPCYSFSCIYVWHVFFYTQLSIHPD